MNILKDPAFTTKTTFCIMPDDLCILQAIYLYELLHRSCLSYLFVLWLTCVWENCSKQSPQTNLEGSMRHSYCVAHRASASINGKLVNENTR